MKNYWKLCPAEFKFEDSWIGVFWKSKRELYYINNTNRESTDKITTDIWICILPWFPIHITRVKYEILTF